MAALLFIKPGSAESQSSADCKDCIKIGLLTTDSVSFAAMNGAELAIREANEKGGMDGKRFRLIIRSMEGPWGTGSRETVSLIFDEKVLALLGSHDGRNAHIAEQAATKSSVVLISAWAGDPTLTQAFVPWFFNCVPNDKQQAEALVKDIYFKKGLKRIMVVTGNDYDSKSATSGFLRSVKESGCPEPELFNFENTSQDPEVLSSKISGSDAQCLVLFCRPEISVKVAALVRQGKIKFPLFGPLMLLNEDVLSPEELQVYDNVLTVPAGNWSDDSYISFSRRYRNAFNENPGLVASYSYDSMSILLEAIRKSRSYERELIQKSLEDIHYRGVTGTISFDSSGNRSGIFTVSGIYRGVPVTTE